MTAPPRGLAVAVFLVSLSGLALELFLLRTLSLRWSHHFASLVIGVGLIGFGASGTILALARTRLQRSPSRWLARIALLFGAQAAFAPSLLARIPFEPVRLPVDPQLPFLASEIVLVVLPFLFAGLFVGLALDLGAAKASRIYAASLLGSAAGAPAATAALVVVEPEAGAFLAGLGGFGAALLMARTLALRERRLTALVFALLAVIAGFTSAADLPPLSEYKGLSRVLGFPDSRIVLHRSGPLGRVDVVASSAIHYAAGLSLNYEGSLPEQRELFIDGGSRGAVTRLTAEPAALTFTSALLGALPYELRRGRRALVIGPGGGLELLLARSHGCQVDAVELNPDVVALMTGELSDFSGRIYTRDGVRVHRAEARSHLARHRDDYAIISVPPLDAFGTLAVTGAAPGETPLYTVEAVREYLDHLEPDGVLALGRWLRALPREELRLIATVIAALEEAGHAPAADRLLIARDWASLIILARVTPWTPDEIAAAGRFLDARSFDWVYAPGVGAADANRFHRLAEPVYEEATRRLLGPEREAFLAAYPFDVHPATDDRPFFFHTLEPGSWEVLRERSGGQLIPVDDWSERLLVASAVLAGIVAFLLLILPLGIAAFLDRSRRTGAPVVSAPGLLRTTLFFAALGLGYLAIEVALLGRLIQFLAQPVAAAAGVLAILLGGSGAGALLSGRLEHPKRVLLPALAGIVLFAALYAVFLPDQLAPLRYWPEGLRWLPVAAILFPLAFLMGIPFPVALEQLAATRPRVIPWAWGVNGFASVLGATLGQWLAIEQGYTAVTLAAGTVYAYAAAEQLLMAPGASGAPLRNVPPRGSPTSHPPAGSGLASAPDRG